MAERDTSTDGPAADPRANYRHGSESVRRPGLAADLDGLIAGDVRFDDYSRQLYTTDASIYEVTPIGVVFPTSTTDVAAVVEYCAERAIPILPRGGGTSFAGQTVNEAVVHHAVGVLRRAGYAVDPLDSGCCGMAGSFGYEAEHHSMSKAIGSILFDQVDDSPGDRVVAPGASCRTQLGDHYEQKPPTPV
jgi:hypothetical protein